MTDPHDIRKSQIESAMINDAEDRAAQPLNYWIAEHVMGWVGLRSCFFSSSGWAGFDQINNPFPHDKGEEYVPSYTNDRAAAMAVLEKCQEKLDCEDVQIGFCAGNWHIKTVYRENPADPGRIAIYPTMGYSSNQSLEMAICLLAKALFS